MNMKKTTLISLIIASLAPIAYAIFYNILPEQVPMHYNFQGDIDGYGSKLELLIMALIPIVSIPLFSIIPKIDPKGKNYEKFKGFYRAFILVFIIFISLMFGVILTNSLIPNTIDVTLFVCITIGILFMFIGNYMPRAKQNYSFGIKTPWTLSSEKVWNKTHRIAGFCFFFSGLIFIIIPFTSSWVTIVLFVKAIAIVAIIPTLMSYVFYKQDATR